MGNCNLHKKKICDICDKNLNNNSIHEPEYSVCSKLCQIQYNIYKINNIKRFI
jgi:hypothetical protein